MQELEKILEEMKEIKDGNRKEKLYAKYPPHREDQKVLNAYSQGYEDGTDNFYNAVVEIIRKHMNDGWIPVGERPPEDDVDVLITYADIDDENYTDICITTYGYAYLGGNKLDFKEWRSPLEYFRSNYKVIAWQPLPEPYHPEATEAQRPEWKDRMLHTFLGGHK